MSHSTAFARQGHTVLVVDDTPANLGLVVEYLEERGLCVLVAQNGEEGLQRAQLARPDLILLDVMMPVMDGFETCRRLKADERTRDIPVIFMTALTDAAEKVTAFEAGGIDYVTKPFQIEEVLLRVKTHLALRESEARYKLLVDMSPDAILVECENGIVFANPAAQRLFRAATLDELLGRSMRALAAADCRTNVEAAFCEIMHGSEPRTTEEMVLAVDGTPVDVSVTRVALIYGGKPAIQMVARDISERKVLENRLKYQATHDDLTGLPNRNLFMDRLGQALAYYHRHQGRFIVAFIDLDRFKWINDSLGHETGDELLKIVSVRMSVCLRESDTVARLGGDEFVLLLQNSGEGNEAMQVLARVAACISQPIMLSGHDVVVSCSMGCSAYPDDGSIGEDLIRFADAAMYRAKESGRNSIQIYNAELRRQIDQRVTLETELRHAIEHEEFSLHYQPQVEAHTGRIVAVEALLRWHHPTLGNIPPSRFIPIAEEAGLIEAIGEWVLLSACKQNRAWQQAGLPPITVAVNLSTKQLNSDALEDQLRRCLTESGLDPCYLELELTESVSMENPVTTVPLLQRLKKLGVSLALDDFGTGYSNMHYLKRLPIDKLKLDGSFIKDIAIDAGSLAIVDAIITMGHRLGLKLIAEMAETERQVTLLASRGCDYIQGYYFSRALPADQCASLLRENRLPLNRAVGALECK